VTGPDLNSPRCRLSDFVSPHGDQLADVRPELDGRRGGARSLDFVPRVFLVSAHGQRDETRRPMTLGNMRSLGPALARCDLYEVRPPDQINVDTFPDDVAVPSFGPRMRCGKCGHLGANVRPDWTQLRGTSIASPALAAITRP
jgi:hypothetical protein